MLGDTAFWGKVARALFCMPYFAGDIIDEDYDDDSSDGGGATARCVEDGDESGGGGSDDAHRSAHAENVNDNGGPHEERPTLIGQHASVVDVVVVTAETGAAQIRAKDSAKADAELGALSAKSETEVATSVASTRVIEAADLVQSKKR